MAEIKAFVFQNVEKVLKKQKNEIPQPDLVKTEEISATKDPAQPETSAAAAEIIDENATRIIVLDDDPSFTSALTRLLRSAGYAPYAANSPDDIFVMIERIKPDLVILDLKMPGTSGSFIAAALSQNPLTKNIPVIILSGMISVYDQTMVKKASGNQYFLAKSADPATWLETIAKILQ